jgi:hypothetical protein
MSRTTFHTARLMAWVVQLPLLLIADVRESIPYLAFLSLAALIESAATDVDQARADARAARDDAPAPPA